MRGKKPENLYISTLKNIGFRASASALPGAEARKVIYGLL
jgi:hypothetical protein